MDLCKTYQDVSKLLDTIDFSTLFPGFRRYPFALYTSREICLNGTILPYQEEFRGNTAISFNGEFIAIWNVEFDPVEDRERLAYSLVHEMFHCHQRVNGEERFPSDLTLLQYPDDTGNFLRKYNENRCLAEAYTKNKFLSFQQFAKIREQRAEQYPEMVRQEWKVETIEGLAEYVGLQALRQINAETFAAVTAEYVDKLCREGRTIFDIRRISYFSGALYFLCLDQFGQFTCRDFVSEQTAYEQNPIESDGVTVSIHPYDFIEREYAALCQQREETVAKHMKNAEYVACRAVIYGYDPMNMFRSGTLIDCSHFVCLKENGETTMVASPVVLQLAEGSERDIVGYYRYE